MVWTSANGPKCPVSREDRGEIVGPPLPPAEGATTMSDEAGEVCDGCGRLLICRHCGKFRSAAPAPQTPDAVRAALEKIANLRPSLVPQELVDMFIDARLTAKSALAALSRPKLGGAA